MSPFSQFLYELRSRHNLRQADLAIALGYEQSYISALEVGIKGPPTGAFVERLIDVLKISPSEQIQLRIAMDASQCKLVIPKDADEEIYWLLKDLRDEMNAMSRAEVKVIREILKLRRRIVAEGLGDMRVTLPGRGDSHPAGEAA